MLSVVIPIYNKDVTSLVNALLKQCRRLKVEFQILCFDDGSRDSFKQKNRKLGFHFGVSYVEMPTNLGRSGIRNMLAQNARFENLLFLDCDSGMVRRTFLKAYLPYLGKNHLVNGGRIYAKSKPRSKKKILHWAYGQKYESLPAKKRSKNPSLNFHSNNFLTSRSLMLKYPFDEALEGYGYEDVAFAERYRRNNIEIIHIDNPIRHLDIIPTDVFLEKTKNAIDNLIRFHRLKKIPNTRLISMYAMLKKWKILPLVVKFYNKRQHEILQNLQSQDPKLWYLQLYKLVYFTQRIEN